MNEISAEALPRLYPRLRVAPAMSLDGSRGWGVYVRHFPANTSGPLPLLFWAGDLTAALNFAHAEVAKRRRKGSYPAYRVTVAG